MTAVTGPGIAFDAFDAASLLRQLGSQSQSSGEYLIDYLRYYHASSIIVEDSYIDRHYLDEYAHYYSRSFQPLSPRCKRLHFFGDLTCDQLRDRFRSVIGEVGDLSPQGKADLAAVQEAYLGFIVMRPLPSAPVGRTVLRPYPREDRRRFDTSRIYRVHLAGITLQVQGLAFQHQDGGAAVCASTALWCALQRIAPMSGNRTPTPHAVTVAANSPYPASHGLYQADMATALCKLGYIADCFQPAENRDRFRALLVTCLESGLPVILLMQREMPTGAGKVAVGHAVALTGYSESGDVVSVPCTDPREPPLLMRSGSLKVVYAHDDNLGPYAHYELADDAGLDENGHKKLTIRRGDPGNPRPRSWNIDVWDVLAALVPKPDKLRLSVTGLVDHIAHANAWLVEAFEGMSLHYGTRFNTGIGVKEGLRASDLDRSQRETLLLELPLPRYVGVIDAFHGGDLLCSVIIDVTEVSRRSGQPSILAIVANGVRKQSIAGARLELFAERQFGVPIAFRRAD